MGPPGARSDRLWRPTVRASWNLGSRAWWLGPVESTTSSELDVKHSCRTAKEGPAMVQVHDARTAGRHSRSDRAPGGPMSIAHAPEPTRLSTARTCDR